MPEYVIMSYNIEHMNKMFENNTIKPGEVDRAEKIAKVIKDIKPHVLGICEAANAAQEHQHFIDKYLSGSGYKLAAGISRGAQNLVFYYRDPFKEVDIDPMISFYDPWEDDIEIDGLKELYKWERKPLEVIFEIGDGGPKVRCILVHTKSKGIFSVVDFYNFQKISQANRKRLVSQSVKLRSRLDDLLLEQNPIPTIVLGDMNDGPGMDPFEKMLGKSFVETVMGSVSEPALIYHNALWYMSKDNQLKNNLWTADFEDPIVTNPLGFKHRVWIDHIQVSPDMLQPTNPVQYVMNSGKIGEKDATSRAASDHFPVYCNIRT